MRINKYLALCGVASRRKSEQLILDKKVTVNDKVLTDLAYKVNVKTDKVCVLGNKVSLPTNYVYYKLNKPKGYICTASDDRNRKTIYELVKSPVRLFSIGRLDYNTEGLIILTNDGDLAQKISHPSHETEKEYIVKIEGEIKESELAVLRAGVVENGKRLPPAKVELLETKDNFSRLSVTIHEGQNRQIRRMFECIGKTIVLLKRIRIGKIKLGGLNRGEYKKLSDVELYYLLGE